MDPLAILKEFCLNGQLDLIEIEDDRVKFGDKYSFPKQQPTAFKSKEGQGDHYGLEAVAFFIKQIVANPAMGPYVAAVQRNKIPAIDFKDREPLRGYLTGKVQHTVHIADVVPTVTFYEPAAKKQRIDDEGEAAALKHLLEQEKQLRDRNSLLCAPGANFKSVLDMLDKVLAARKAAELQQAQQAQKAAAGAKQQRQAAAGQQQQQQRQAQQQKPAAPAFMKPSGRMERNDVVGQVAAMGGDASLAANIGYGYGIQDAAKAAAAAAAAGGSGAGSGRPASGSGSQQQHRSSSKPDVRAAAASAAGSKGHQKSGSSSGIGSAAGKHREPPIILVPSGVTAMINMFNAKQFLEEGKFVPSAEAAAAVNSVKPAKVDFKRTVLRSGPHFPRYHVTDRVPRPGHPDWKRVVAVIVQGKAWQFKDFPFKGADKGDVRETLSQLFGAYFYYSDEKVPETVDGWKVLKLPLRRHGRHLDHTVMLDFYTKLDAFLQGKRCKLEY